MRMPDKIIIKDKWGEELCVYRVRPGRSGLAGADLEGQVLHEAVLEGENLRGACLYWAILFQANLRAADLSDANLRGANLKEADLEGANLRGANLGPDNLGGSTDICGANLARADLSTAILDQAEYDENTVFPEGFDPSAHGMVKVGED